MGGMLRRLSEEKKIQGTPDEPLGSVREEREWYYNFFRGGSSRTTRTEKGRRDAAALRIAAAPALLARVVASEGIENPLPYMDALQVDLLSIEIASELGLNIMHVRANLLLLSAHLDSIALGIKDAIPLSRNILAVGRIFARLKPKEYAAFCDYHVGYYVEPPPE